MLEALLRRGAYTSKPVPPPPTGAVGGPDAAWLRLQQDVINLAIEALARPPAAPAKKGS